MGNIKSQPYRQSKAFYLLYLLQRSWSTVTDRRKDENQHEDTDRETTLSSECRGCGDCVYHQDSLIFDSESDMAPNAEEELLVVRPWGPQPEKERLRPPTYNAEDYAIALRRWGRRPLPCVQDSQDTLPSTTSSSSGYASGSGEMTLRQFTSVSELLNKLRADLRLAFPSFVQEFASPPADGITLLLETLRGVQLAQSTPPGDRIGPRIATRRAALDELGCVECLAACAERCSDAPRLLVQAQPGLLALAVCLTSSLNRSRVLALQLLTKVCQTVGGHAAVSEAVSTLRLKYGEGGRFRFLAGALLAPRAAIALRVAGVSFLNAFLKSAPRTQSRLYIQAEACEAGLEPEVLHEWLRESDDREEDALTELLRKEVQKWTHNCVDVDALQRRALRAEETCRILSKKVSALQAQLRNIQLGKLNGYDDENLEETRETKKTVQQISSNAEDEGISSSERSSSPENSKEQSTVRRKMTSLRDNDQETTIDDVIEELRIIVKDAEEEFSDKTAAQDRPTAKTCSSSDRASVDNRNHNSTGKNFTPEGQIDGGVSKSREKGERVTYFGNDREGSVTSSASRKFNSFRDSRRISKSSKCSSNEDSVRIVVKGGNCEDAIVPAILHPQPPRRAAPCLSAIMAARHFSPANFVQHEEEAYNSYDEELEEETLGDGSDSLLSASRLKYNEKTRSDNGERATRTERNVQHFRKVSAKRFEDEEEDETKRRMSKHCASKYRSEVEKRKHLRRSSSHDYLESSSSTGRSKNANRVECRIRKFESLSSFDDPSKWRMRRSESFHHVSHFDRKDRLEGLRGGSDSGLIYITDFNLDPLVAPKSPSLHAKSLDRIDEGLDSMVNIVITEEKNQRNAGRHRSKVGELKTGETSLLKGRFINDEPYDSRNRQLMSDELYEDQRARRFANFSNIRPNDSAIFAGRTYDTFGLGKSRFNAGKYSGEQQQQQQQQQRNKDDLPVRRNTTSSFIGKRGKVTDIVSGLY